MTEGFPSLTPAPCWFVMFSGEGKRQYLIDYLSPANCQHVNAFFYDPAAERWIVYDVNRAGVVVTALTGNEFDVWMTVMRYQHGARVLKCDWRPTRRLPLQIGMWCVVAVRYAIGSRSRAIRPIGLYRDLLREGAQPAFA